jgi:hypothetical protein
LSGSMNQQDLSGTQSQSLAQIQGQYNELIASDTSASNMYTAYTNQIGAVMNNQNIPVYRAADTVTALQNITESGLAVIDAINGGSITPETAAKANAVSAASSNAGNNVTTTIGPQAAAATTAPAAATTTKAGTTTAAKPAPGTDVVNPNTGIGTVAPGAPPSPASQNGGYGSFTDTQVTPSSDSYPGLV